MYHFIKYSPGWHGGPSFPLLIARNSHGGMSLLLTATRRLIKENFGICNVDVMATNPSYGLYGSWQFNESKRMKRNSQWGKSRWLRDHVSASVLRSILHMSACPAQLPIEVMLIARLLDLEKRGCWHIECACLFDWFYVAVLLILPLKKAPEDPYRPFTY